MTEVLVIWDFDCTFIDEDSDEIVVKNLSAKVVQEKRDIYASNTMHWVELMNHTVHRLAEEGISRNQIETCIANIPLHNEVVETLKLCAKRQYDTKIVSDANQVFINVFLEANNIRQYIGEIFTNPAEFDEKGILNIRRYHSPELPPHGCPECPVNMCKGAIINKILTTKKYDKVYYIGDGNGDYCPCSKLTKHDHVLCRKGYPLEKNNSKKTY